MLSYGNTTYTYSANGELQVRTENGQSTVYTYDVLGNLTQVLLAAGTKIDYLIDGQNRRVGKQVNDQLVYTLLYQDQLNPIAQIDANGTITRFIYGSRAHVPDYMIRCTKRYRIVSDHFGSVRYVIDLENGEAVQENRYDAWGNVVGGYSHDFQPFGFAGGLYDVETRLVRFGARDYDASIGRWTTKDPIGFAGGDTNLYGYVGGDPVNYLDINGEQMSLNNCELIATETLSSYSVYWKSRFPGKPIPNLICSNSCLSAGKYDYTTKTIIVCCNNLHNEWSIKATIAHEFQHAIDDNLKTDWGNCEDRACSEIKAHKLTCVPNSPWMLPNENKQDCVKRGAKQSVWKICAGKVVDQVFSRCY